MVGLFCLLLGSPELDDLPERSLSVALRAVKKAESEGRGRKHILTLIDYSLPSTSRRLFVIDLTRNRVLFQELVAHGKGSDRDGAAVRFSNEPHSLSSSLGLYETLGTYYGKHGYSLALEGLEPGFNDKAKGRAIVMHGAWYVSDAFAKQHGRLGRSFGCPALDAAVVRQVIGQIEGGSFVFIYYPERRWLSESRFLK